MSSDPVSTPAAARELVKKSLIVALDVSTQEEALALIDALEDRVRYVKIGHRLFSRYGPQILDECGKRGVQVFLDLKLYDIPSVVGDACSQIAAHDAVFMMTVHASGGRLMLEAAVAGVHRVDDEKNRPFVVAVTALTSFSDNELPEIGVDIAIGEWAARLGQLAIDAGVDGLVSSTREVPNLRNTHGQEPILVTPGIRLPGRDVSGDDQQRVSSPAGALSAGSTMLVIGRPIYQADDPVAVIDLIADSILQNNDLKGPS